MSGSIGDGLRFEIVGERSDSLAVHLLGYSNPSATDWSDGNWLDVEVKVEAGAFSARFRAKFRIDELERFYADVAALYERLTGEAVFETMEGQLELRASGDGRGHITVVGMCVDDASPANTLRFALRLDQTQLFGTKVQLADVLGRYPELGERPGNGQ